MSSSGFLSEGGSGGSPVVEFDLIALVFHFPSPSPSPSVLSAPSPSSKVEVVALAPAITGDMDYALAFRKKINGRVTRMVGDGFRDRDGRRTFEVGDIITQVLAPFCVEAGVDPRRLMIEQRGRSGLHNVLR
jgi:hypothetical protein